MLPTFSFSYVAHAASSLLSSHRFQLTATMVFPFVLAPGYGVLVDKLFPPTLPPTGVELSNLSPPSSPDDTPPSSSDSSPRASPTPERATPGPTTLPSPSPPPPLARQPAPPQPAPFRAAPTLTTLPYPILSQILTDTLSLPPHMSYSCPHRHRRAIPGPPSAKPPRREAHPREAHIRQPLHLHPTCGFGPGWSCKPASPHPSPTELSNQLAILRVSRSLHDAARRALMDRAFEIEIRADRLFFLGKCNDAALKLLARLDLALARRVQVTVWRCEEDPAPTSDELGLGDLAGLGGLVGHGREPKPWLVLVARVLGVGRARPRRTLRRVDVLLVVPEMGRRHADLGGDRSLMAVEGGVVHRIGRVAGAAATAGEGGSEAGADMASSSESAAAPAAVVRDWGRNMRVGEESGALKDALKPLRRVRSATVGFALVGTETQERCEWSKFAKPQLWRLSAPMGSEFVNFQRWEGVYIKVFEKVYEAVNAQGVEL